MSAIPSPFGGQLPIPSRAKQLDPPSGCDPATARNWVLNGKVPAPFQAGAVKLVSKGDHEATPLRRDGRQVDSGGDPGVGGRGEP